MGYHFAAEYAKHGANVIATARSLESMAGLSSMPGTITTMVLDVTKRDQVERVVSDIISSAGCIDVLLNNAGAMAAPVISLVESDMDGIRATFEVNVYGTVHMCQVVGMHMARRRSGHIINNGSTASMIGVPYNASYCASKWAVEGLTHTLRNEMRPLGVKVTYLAPGAVKTNLLRPNTVNPPPATSPFAPYQEVYNKVYLETLQASGIMRADVFARRVVSALMRPNPPAVLVDGSFAALIHWLSWLLPAIPLDTVLNAQFNAYMPKEPAAPGGGAATAPSSS